MPRKPDSRPKRSGVLRNHGQDFERLLRLLDPLVAGISFWLLAGDSISANFADQSRGLIISVRVVLFTALILPPGRLYQSYRQSSLLTLVRRLSVSWCLVLAALLAVAFLLKDSAYLPRQACIAWAAFVWCYLTIVHVGGRTLLRRLRILGGNSRTIVYWGRPDAAVAFYTRLQTNPYLGLHMAAWFSPISSGATRLPPGMPACGGNLSDLRRWLSSNIVDQIVFSYVARDDLSMADLIRFFGDTCIPVTYAPTWVQPGMTFRVEAVGDQPCIDLWRPAVSPLDRQFKRGFDIIVSGAALLLLSPLLLAIALAVRCSSAGPVLFLQDRYGLDGRRFKIYKFRTMRVVESGDQPGLRQATRNDPRITAVGAVLRRWSLDELPQLVNVLQGQMSIVGPRPHAVDHNEQYRALIPGYMQRHLFKPGITGLAQVQGYRGETATLEAMASRVAADLEYQRDWSLAGDLKILIKTVLHLRSPNAY